MATWSPYALTYDPLKSGSIDGTDADPHDVAIVRALYAKYRLPKNLKGDGRNCLLVARLDRDTTEETLRNYFKKYGDLENVRIVRNIVTGFSQGYAFVQYALHSDAEDAWHRAHQEIIDGRQIIVEFEQERSLEGWIPRRLGGGFGGKKESGQLRFGCRERPFRKPIHVIEDTKSRPMDRFDESRDLYRTERVRFNNRNRSRSRDRRRSRSRDRRRSRSRDRRRSRSRDRLRSRSRNRSRDRKQSRERSRSGSRSKGMSRRRRSRSKNRSKGRSRSRERHGRY